MAMCSLALFPPPLPYGESTLCESNNELLSGTSTEDRSKQVGKPAARLLMLCSSKSLVHINYCFFNLSCTGSTKLKHIGATLLKSLNLLAFSLANSLFNNTF